MREGKIHLVQRLLCLGLILAVQACMPTGFLASSKNTTNANQSLATDPKTQTNDRPTETGAGVPGYLVNCSEVSATGELLQVGCSVSNQEGTRIKTSADAWTRYDIQLMAGTNPSIKVNKSVATGMEAWDVAFSFTGASLADMQTAARGSTYSYIYVNEKGETVKAETAAPVGTIKPASQNAQSCTGGVLVENACFVSVPMSCTDYCGQSQMQVHPWVIERYGSMGSSSSNKQACRELYTKLPRPEGTPNFSFLILDAIPSRGLGCHSLGLTQPLFDASPTDPAGVPYIGQTRICACQ